MKVSIFFLFCIIVTQLVAENAEPRCSASFVYRRLADSELLIQVFEPETKNGAGVLYFVSAGYESNRSMIKPADFAAFLKGGYTVFAVTHRPRGTHYISEMQSDVLQAVKFVRHHAAEFGVDARKLAAYGSSSGGQLALVVATQGGPSMNGSADPVDRESSEVQVVGCIFPPTDFLNWGKVGEDSISYGASHGFDPPVGPKDMSAQERYDRQFLVSPINFITRSMAPAMIVQGDQDDLVPVYQALTFQKKCREKSARCEVVLLPGKGHSFAGWRGEMERFVVWFDAILFRIDVPKSV